VQQRIKTVFLNNLLVNTPISSKICNYIYIDFEYLFMR